MRRLVILFALFFASILAFAYGEESIGQKTNTEAGRYEIIMPDNMIRYTFKLDKFTGDIWQLVKIVMIVPLGKRFIESLLILIQLTKTRLTIS